MKSPASGSVPSYGLDAYDRDSLCGTMPMEDTGNGAG